MTFPKISHCLVCEEAREERYRKLAILGFYGVAPDVEILVKDLALPLRQLTFVFLAGPGGGSAKVSIQLDDEKGNVVFRSGELPVEITDTPKRGNFVVGLGNVKFPHPGRYTFKLMLEGKNHYDASFEVRPGTPEDFG